MPRDALPRAISKITRLLAHSHSLPSTPLSPRLAPPDVFGLHSHAEISYGTNAARNLWKSLIDLQPRVRVGSSGKQCRREAHISQITLNVDQRLSKQPFDLAAQRDFNGVPTPTQVRSKEKG